MTYHYSDYTLLREANAADTSSSAMNNPSSDAEAGQGQTRQQRPRSSFSSLLFLCLMLFLLTSHNSDEFLARHHYQDALQVLSHQLSNYTAWLNGTSTNFTVVRVHVPFCHTSLILEPAGQKTSNRFFARNVPRSRKEARSCPGVLLS